MQDAVDRLMGMLEDSKASFEKAAEDLLRKTQHDQELWKHMRAVVDTHCHFVTGLVEWTLTSARYQLEDYMQDDGSVDIPLLMKAPC